MEKDREEVLGSDRSPRPPVGPGDGQWLTFDKPNVPGAGAFGRFLRRELDALELTR